MALVNKMLNKNELEKIRKKSGKFLLSQLNLLDEENKFNLFCYIYAILEIFKDEKNPNKLLAKQLLSDIDNLEIYNEKIIYDLFVETVTCVKQNKNHIKNDEVIKTILMYELYTL